MSDLKNFIPSDEVGVLKTMLGAMRMQMQQAGLTDTESPDWKGTLCVDEMYITGALEFEQSTQRVVGGCDFDDALKIASSALGTALTKKINQSQGGKYGFSKPDVATRYTIWYVCSYAFAYEWF